MEPLQKERVGTRLSFRLSKYSRWGCVFDWAHIFFDWGRGVAVGGEIFFTFYNYFVYSLRIYTYYVLVYYILQIYTTYAFENVKN